MNQNISLGSNGENRVRSLRIILTRPHGTNFRTSWARFAPSFVRHPNRPECTQIVRNAPKQQFRVQWGVDRVRSLRIIPMRPHGTNFCTSSARFASSFVRHHNGPECTQIVRKTRKCHFRVQWRWIGCVRCEKFRREFVARTFVLVRPVGHRVS